LALINTDISFGMGAAAGTGMVIDSDGIVVTNHHVVARSTAVWVTIPATGQTYSADVLGYDPATDVAVLQLQDAQGLSTVVTDTAQLDVGQAVTSVGNAQGGGELVSATGQVTGLGQNITVTGDDGSESDLFDLIAVNADMVPGDSGGALLDSDGEVVGMNVAGSKDPTDDVGYAIPISTVLDIASDVLAGRDTGTITLGRTGALGVTVSTISQDLVIVGVVADGPADQVGMTVGSQLTAVDSQPVATRADLAAILAAHRPGDQVQVAWTDENGAPHEATVTLTTAPLA
jgi:S1-C subfamily serine protease